jgi:hypothetical protein
MILIIEIVMVWTTLAGEPWFGIGISLGLWWVRGMWRYVWPATRRKNVSVLSARSDSAEGGETYEES